VQKAFTGGLPEKKMAKNTLCTATKKKAASEDKGKPSTGKKVQRYAGGEGIKKVPAPGKTVM